MSIDIFRETLIPLAEASKLLPKRRGGKEVSLSCLYRWTNEGCRGIRLAYTMCGATRCTSVESLQEFCDALASAAEAKEPRLPPPTALSRTRLRQVEAAERRLAATNSGNKPPRRRVAP